MVQRWHLKVHLGRSYLLLSCLSASIRVWFGKHRALGAFSNPQFPDIMDFLFTKCTLLGLSG